MWLYRFCKWWDIPVRSVLDVGAGVGYWSDWYRNNYSRTKVVSVDVSEHACKYINGVLDKLAPVLRPLELKQKRG